MMIETRDDIPIATRKLIAFRHETPLGKAPAHQLFERVVAKKCVPESPARSFDDYVVLVDGLESQKRLIRVDYPAKAVS